MSNPNRRDKKYGEDANEDGTQMAEFFNFGFKGRWKEGDGLSNYLISSCVFFSRIVYIKDIHFEFIYLYLLKLVFFRFGVNKQDSVNKGWGREIYLAILSIALFTSTHPRLLGIIGFLLK